MRVIPIYENGELYYIPLPDEKENYTADELELIMRKYLAKIRGEDA